MENRMKRLEDLVQVLNNKVSDLEFKMLQMQKSSVKSLKTKTPGETSLGVLVWEAYRGGFSNRYGVEPVRNAKVNRMCGEMAKRLGTDGPEVARFYLTLNDTQYLRFNHPIGMLVQNCESVHSMWKRGRMTTVGQARTIEKASGNISASQSYLERKHGKN